MPNLYITVILFQTINYLIELKILSFTFMVHGLLVFITNIKVFLLFKFYIFKKVFKVYN